MLVRNLEYLSIPKEFKKVELEIFEDNNLCLVSIENKGFALIFKKGDKIDSIFLLKTELNTQEIVLDNNVKDKEDFINVIHMLLDRIYSGANIPEFEKKHHEHVFLKLMYLFENNEDVEIINEDNSKLYGIIEKGFMKLDVDIMNSKIESLNSSIANVSNNFESSIRNIEENNFGNKVKKVFDQ